MAEQLKAEIVAGKFRVGPNPAPPNEFKLSITNSGDAIEWTPDVHLYLTGHLGPDDQALFLEDSDARKWTMQYSSSSGWKPKWQAEWDFSRKSEGIFRLDIYTSNVTDWENGVFLAITFLNVVSKTAPGEASLTFESDISGAKQDFSISKTVDKPDIISFTSDPAEGVQNLPNENVTLKWRVYKLNQLELTRVGSADLLPFETREHKESNTIEGIATVPNISVDTEFRLRGYDGPRPVDRTLGIKVLRNDWYDLKKTILPGDPGYPISIALQAGLRRFDLEPTLLFNVNDKSLYAIFQHDFDGGKRALLFQTENPFAGWNFVKSSVSGQEGSIPEGFATSPGLCFDNRLWLIGGSQIDADITSNEVWRLNLEGPGKGVWENLSEKWQAPVWSQRMGHAVVEFGGHIWVMGGLDEYGKALNDVWALDAAKEGSEWRNLGNALWGPRCLISPTVYEDQIWVYGGTTEPKTSNLYDDLYAYSKGRSFSEGRWEEKKITAVIRGNESRKPVASCLQVFQEKFYLFGKFQTVAESDKSYLVESLAFSLSSLDSRTWSRFPSDRLQNWWGDTTCSYQLANFKDRMLIARALGKNQPNTLGKNQSNTVLKVYVA